jgi:hypothetical protein
MVANEVIQSAYNELIKAYDIAVSKAIDTMEMKKVLETAETSLLAAGEIEGANAEIRTAKLKAATGDQRKWLYEEELAKKNADAAVEIIRMEIESYKWQIRNTSNLLREKELSMGGKTDE